MKKARQYTKYKISLLLVLFTLTISAQKPIVDRVIFTPQGAPSSPTEGFLYGDNTTNTIYYYNGTIWVDLGAGGGGGISNIVEDVTPQLGSDLDGQGFNISNIGNLTTTGILNSSGSTNLQNGGVTLPGYLTGVNSRTEITSGGDPTGQASIIFIPNGADRPLTATDTNLLFNGNEILTSLSGVIQQGNNTITSDFVLGTNGGAAIQIDSQNGSADLFGGVAGSSRTTLNLTANAASLSMESTVGVTDYLFDLNYNSDNDVARKVDVDAAIAGIGGSGVTDGDKGDITVSGSGATWNIDADAVGPNELDQSAAYYFAGTENDFQSQLEVRGTNTANEIAILNFKTFDDASSNAQFTYSKGLAIPGLGFKNSNAGVNDWLILADAGGADYDGVFTANSFMKDGGGELIESDITGVTGGTSFKNTYFQTQAGFDTDGGTAPANTFVVIPDAPPAEVVTGTAIDLEYFQMLDDRAVDSNAFTFSNADPGDLAIIYLDQSGAPTYSGTGLTFVQLTGTTAWADDTYFKAYFEVQADGTTIHYFYQQVQ
ncbi:hypothetical protein [Flagellimonas sp. CMM7]|uniref:hypothetical protein n=1 Tax=Flagellimonas sp. CMM7 TaxID=2654676 RepID=UPI0013D6E45B|nr:hypothetical protein [Flagellimonas sp. CMM7]UII79995.1 hypothetical protein LV704_00390 [Flagellimonas sp. CMM7]